MLSLLPQKWSCWILEYIHSWFLLIFQWNFSIEKYNFNEIHFYLSCKPKWAYKITTYIFSNEQPFIPSLTQNKNNEKSCVEGEIMQEETELRDIWEVVWDSSEMETSLTIWRQYYWIPPIKSILFSHHRENHVFLLVPFSIPNLSGSAGCTLITIYVTAIAHIPYYPCGCLS